MIDKQMICAYFKKSPGQARQLIAKSFCDKFREELYTNILKARLAVRSSVEVPIDMTLLREFENLYFDDFKASRIKKPSPRLMDYVRDLDSSAPRFDSSRLEEDIQTHLCKFSAFKRLFEEFNDRYLRCGVLVSIDEDSGKVIPNIYLYASC